MNEFELNFFCRFLYIFSNIWIQYLFFIYSCTIKRTSIINGFLCLFFIFNSFGRKRVSWNEVWLIISDQLVRNERKNSRHERLFNMKLHDHLGIDPNQHEHKLNRSKVLQFLHIPCKLISQPIWKFAHTRDTRVIIRERARLESSNRFFYF